MGKTSWAADVMTRRLKSKKELAFCQSTKLCVCVSLDLFSVSLIYCCLSSYNSSNIESLRMSKEHKGESRSRYRLCVPPCPHYINERGYTQFVRGLIGSEACIVGSQGGRLPAL